VESVLLLVIGAVIGVVLYDMFIGDVLHARLRKAEEVEGPIPETRTMADVEQTEQVEGKVPGTRAPHESETGARQAPPGRRVPPN